MRAATLEAMNIAFQGLGDTSSGGNPAGSGRNAAFNSAEFNVEYQLTPSLLPGAACIHTKGGSVSTATGIGRDQRRLSPVQAPRRLKTLIKPQPKPTGSGMLNIETRNAMSYPASLNFV